MADWGSAIIARLEASDAWLARVGPRTDWTVSPQSTPYPRVVITTVSDPRPDHYGGEQGFRETHIQLDVYSTDSASEATQIAELALEVLRPETVKAGVRFDRASAEGPMDSGEWVDTLFIYRSRVSLYLWHADTLEPDDVVPVAHVWSEVAW
jgi:hypothetical protein